MLKKSTNDWSDLKISINIPACLFPLREVQLLRKT